MSRQLVWLDLCSGLGGASQPALDRGWKVIRVDLDPRFKPDIVADVRSLPLRPFHVDVLWASPPCQEFSKWGLRCFFPNPPAPDLSIANAIYAFKARLKPDFWIVENVFASRPFLNPIYGPPASSVPGHVFWGRLPGLIPLTRPHKGSAQGKRWGSFGVESGGGSKPGLGRRNAADSASIPYEIGEAVCRAVEDRR